VFAAACLVAYARGNETGTCGDGNAITWVFDGDTFFLKGNGFMNGPCDFGKLDETEVSGVVIGDGIRSVYEWTFSSFENVQSLYIGESLEEFGSQAFDMKSLWQIDVNPNNKFFETLDNVLFNKGRTKLVLFPRDKLRGDDRRFYAIPHSVQVIGSMAFARTLIESIHIPNNVTTLEEDAFWGCSRLSSITIPGSVTSIGAGAFTSDSFGDPIGVKAVAYLGVNNPGAGNSIIFDTNPVICVLPHYVSKTFCNVDMPLLSCH